ncbi:MAG: DNA polymerase IV [Chitinophagales bacterium]|nr:DNA polymerase IV [Chitinophagales bacterium]
MQRSILHLDLDTFFVSVERLKNPSLIGKPVIVGHKGGRGVVSSCSYEARKFGVHSAMPMYQALRLCPHAEVVGGDMDDYSNYSRMVTDIIADRAPLFEKSSIDEFYIDLTGMDRFFGAYDWALQLKRDIMKETGLPISFGLASNKMVAKVATGQGKPNGQMQVAPGEEAAFLAPLPVGKIPMIGEKMQESLAQLGINKVHELAEQPLERLQELFGNAGLFLYRRARGMDQSELVAHWEAKSISAERTFHQDTYDEVFLRRLLNAIVEKIAFQLRKDRKLASCVTVRIRYSDFTTVSKQGQIPYTSSDHRFIEKAQELFTELYHRGRLVRLAGVRLSGLVHGGNQINLFDDKEEDIKLYQALDSIRMRYGSGKVYRAAGMGVMSHREEVNPFQKRI